MPYDIRSAQLLFAAAQENNLNPEWLDEPYGFFSYKIYDRLRYCLNSVTCLNSQIGNNLSRNKHLTRVALEKAGFPNIPYCIPISENDVTVFLSKYQDAVLKTVVDKKPKHIQHIRSLDDLSGIDLSTGDFILEQYIRGTEMRYLFLKRRIVAVHERQPIGSVWENPGAKYRISHPQMRWNAALEQMSISIAHTLGLGFCAVDFLVTENGKPYILEINSAPCVWVFHKPDEGPGIDLASWLIETEIRSFL